MRPKSRAAADVSWKERYPFSLRSPNAVQATSWSTQAGAECASMNLSPSAAACTPRVSDPQWLASSSNTSTLLIVSQLQVETSRPHDDGWPMSGLQLRELSTKLLGFWVRREQKLAGGAAAPDQSQLSSEQPPPPSRHLWAFYLQNPVKLWNSKYILVALIQLQLTLVQLHA